MKSNIAVIGLAVMGENIALNIERNGYNVTVYNRTPDKTEKFMNGRGEGKNFFPAYDLKELCNSLEKPRKILLMVKSGQPVDDTTRALITFLDEGDIIIDGGNSNFHDTQRRVEEYGKEGILFVGSGVSGGEFGALYGPSLMPGGNEHAWKHIKGIFEAISAKAGKEGNVPCTAWIGSGGSGHFVKMIHNGIEYGDMQVICEAYDMIKRVLKHSNAKASDLFTTWNKGKLESYLIEITADILKFKDNDVYVVDKILDTAGQKGTGKWTGITALEEDIPLNLITESVFSRYISSQKDIRVLLSKIYPSNEEQKREVYASFETILPITDEDIENALYAAKLISYAQGFELMGKVSSQMNWGINRGEVARIWRGGCIIRSAFLDDITNAYKEDNNLTNLLFSTFYKNVLPQNIESLRKVVALATLKGIPVACFSAALNYYDAITTASLPANLLQAQRDYFGAHTYERVDLPRGEFVHTNWTGEGGDTVSTVYV